MSEPLDPGALPPDLPPEYAEAYRRGYERAWAGSLDEPAPAEPAYVVPEPEPDFMTDVEPEPWYGPTHREPGSEWPRWLVPALIGTLVLALVLGAYGVGRLFSDAGSAGPAAPDGDEGTRVPRPKPVEGQAWDGEVVALTPESASASCVLGPSEDAAGRPVTYDAVNAFDGDFTTAWRCSGDGVGVTLRLTLGQQARLGEVGLVPGYAKTDPQSGADRYAENNRLTRVRWTFADGTSVVQRLDGSPENRDLQSLRIPPVETDEVTLEVLESESGPRNTVAISEVLLSETVG
ncbi:MAG TPA: hypothetical protein VLI04_00690 [Nocardioidaceae bacterium]|nr:hypothetical protein [Nocardioidaceae bacterium]